MSVSRPSDIADALLHVTTQTNQSITCTRLHCTLTLSIALSVHQSVTHAIDQSQNKSRRCTWECISPPTDFL